jgi:hypothetical protein
MPNSRGIAALVARPLLLLLMAIGIAGAVVSVTHLEWIENSFATDGLVAENPH